MCPCVFAHEENTVSHVADTMSHGIYKILCSSGVADQLCVPTIPYSRFVRFSTIRTANCVLSLVTGLPVRIKALDMKHVAAIDDNIVRSTRGSIAFDEVHEGK